MQALILALALAAPAPFPKQVTVKPGCYRVYWGGYPGRNQLLYLTWLHKDGRYLSKCDSDYYYGCWEYHKHSNKLVLFEYKVGWEKYKPTVYTITFKDRYTLTGRSNYGVITNLVPKR